MHAARGGIVWSFVEGNADNSDANPNTIVIRHDANDAEHDDPFGTGPVTTYARYLHGAYNGITTRSPAAAFRHPFRKRRTPAPARG